MGWLEKLEKLFHIEFKEPLLKIDLKINFVNNSYNKPEVKQKTAYLDVSEKKLYLNLDELNKEQKLKLPELLHEAVNEDNKILEADVSDLLNNLHKYKKETSDKQILEFFKPLIPENDLEAL